MMTQKKINPLRIIQKYTPKNSKAYQILVIHSVLVTKKAIKIAKRVPYLKPDINFIKEAGMLHDIGILKTDAKKLGCTGCKPYIFHGVAGREILEQEGFPKHAKVCERHTGVGLSVKEIIAQKLPLPHRDLRPKSIEEKIIAYADKFYSKNPEKLEEEKSIKTIKEELEKYGIDKVKKFEEWVKLFGK